MTLRPFIAAIALALGAAACSQRPASDAFTAVDVAAIKQVSRDLTSAFNAGHTAQVLEHYPENIVFMPPNSGTIRGKEWLKGYYDALLAPGNVTLALEPKDVSGHGPMAYESGTFSLTTRGASGEETRDRGKYLFVLRRAAGHWRYEYAIWNSDLPKPLVTAAAN